MKAFPRIRIYSPAEIKAIRAELRDSRINFARRFLVSPETVKGWETGRRNPQGPALVIMQDLERMARERKQQRLDTIENIRQGRGGRRSNPPCVNG